MQVFVRWDILRIIRLPERYESLEAAAAVRAASQLRCDLCESQHHPTAASTFGVLVMVTSKHPTVIWDHFFKHWITPFSVPQRLIWRRLRARVRTRTRGHGVRTHADSRHHSTAKRSLRTVRGSYSARVPRSSFARVRRVLVSHIMEEEEEAEDLEDEQSDRREDRQQEKEGRIEESQNNHIMSA